MQATNYSYARNNLKTLINHVCDDYEPLIITNKDNRNVVLMSLEEFNSQQETFYLSKSSINNERILNGIKQIEKGLCRKLDI